LTVATIELHGVAKVYGGGVHAVSSLNLQVRDGERLVLLGPSGSGKSTVLRLIAGLEPLTEGEIRLGNRRIDDVPPQERNVAMVFQGYALYGHMSVRGNLAFPLRMHGVPRERREQRVREVAAMLELEPWLDARPAALSGGQQQRVAMGRALVREPQAFLLDEPLSNLDARLRTQVRAHIARIQERLGVTTLYVTHDQVEALTLGHRVAVMRGGRLQQVAGGQELYDHPANTFVAAFVGQPGMNLMSGSVRRGADGISLDLGPVSIQGPVIPSGSEGHVRAPLTDGRRILVGVRPEGCRLVEEEAPGGIQGRVDSVDAVGHERVLRVVVDLRTVDATTEGEGGGPPLAVRCPVDSKHTRPGDRVTVAVDPAALRLFDEDGRALPV
jgi:multiple sugar transport system ATP-binding protein